MAESLFLESTYSDREKSLNKKSKGTMMMIKPDIKNDKDIQTLVYTFYGKVQDDDRFGYIFNEYAEIDWENHFPRMVDYWSNLLLKSDRVKSKSNQKHLPLPIDKKDLFRWFNLFNDTVDYLFEGKQAEYAKKMSEQIASSFTIRTLEEETN